MDGMNRRKKPEPDELDCSMYRMNGIKLIALESKKGRRLRLAPCGQNKVTRLLFKPCSPCRCETCHLRILSALNLACI
ncbi:uncharacterized protein BKA55DRAFT_667886 [Fusarium redolens]|uniref:Uncharacterized protein n=1 Tax=Fusarium redolens TaxID=48865 RepID=A0A9P9JQX2_FUSRE|nr:uncharacterized protein BKA55DRAFT_667886 [Fusarium redolens]KAH7228548.1 hypothetical protein BKA55DRAFT_667886 [Fusarium redolens]